MAIGSTVVASEVEGEEDSWVPTSGQSAVTTNILDINRYSNRRFYRAEDGQIRTSEWISLVAGEHYYIEGETNENGGGDHATWAVEIEEAEWREHPNHVKEVQLLSVSTADQRETYTLTITNPDDGTYRITFMNPLTFKK